MSNRIEKQPSHVYVARKECGCCVGLVTDLADKDTGAHVADFIGSGLAVERVTWDVYKDTVRHEEGFMNCKHGQLALVMAGDKTC